MYQRKRGFTLIELLVVIAIIGILAALIFPTLAKAKSKAKSVACIGNLRQWGIATMVFVDQNNDKLPRDGSPNGLSTSDAWYVDVPKLMAQPEYREMPWKTNHSRSGEKSVWICPSNPSKGSESGKSFWHYAANGNVNGKGSQRQVYFTSIRQPARTVWMFDTQTQLGVLDPVGANKHALFTNLHGSGQHFVFLDGHANHAAADEYWDFENHLARTNNPDFIWRPLGD